jgi:phage replication-related protein YjqB (UPF0714/DUF867 family)
MAYSKDFYPSLTALKRDLVKHRHYRTRVLERGAEVTVIAPHGGYIEPGSSYIARAVSADDCNLYDFQGLRRRRPVELHVTSTRFRDKPLNDLLAHTRLAVSIHSMGPDGPGEIWVGGLNLPLKQRILDELTGQGFKVNGESPRYRGVHPANIVNLASEKGVQIEISADVIATMFASQGVPFGRRVTFLPTTNRFTAFVLAVRTALGLSDSSTKAQAKSA